MSNMLKHEVFMPKNDAHGEAGALLVMPNEVAATLEGYHGARAQTVADTIGSPVLAYERTFSGEGQVFSFAARRNFNADHALFFAVAGRQLDKLIENEGPDKTYLVGHSAATVDVIGVARAETSEYAGIVMTDPVGMRMARPFAEITDYAKYTLVDERQKPSESFPNKRQNPETRQPVSPFDTVRSIASELVVYGAYGASDTGYKMLQHLALNNASMLIDLSFPEHTFTTTRAQQEVLKTELEAARSPEDAPISVNLIDGAYHSTFDNYHYFADTIARALATHS